MDTKNNSNFNNTLPKEGDHLFNKDRNKIPIMIQDINNHNNLTNLTKNKLTSNSNNLLINSNINNRIHISKMILNFIENLNTQELLKGFRNNINIYHNKIFMILHMFNNNKIFILNRINSLSNTQANNLSNSLSNSNIINHFNSPIKDINSLIMNQILKNINKKIH